MQENPSHTTMAFLLSSPPPSATPAGEAQPEEFHFIKHKAEQEKGTVQKRKQASQF